MKDTKSNSSNQKGSDESSSECDYECSSCSQKNTCTDPHAEDAQIKERMSPIKYKILIGSGKGGVGKTTVTVNLGMALAKNGFRVGILDADITGPNIPKMLGIEDVRLRAGPLGIEPVLTNGIKVISMALILSSKDSAVVWRGPMKMAAIKQFIAEVNWGELDYLLVDLPPGTSDEPISLVQLMTGLSGAIIVTTPQDVAVLDSLKAVSMFKLMNVPVLGMIENMSGLRCPHCGEMIDVFKRGGGEKAANDLGIEFLGAIPIDPQIGTLADSGQTMNVVEMASWNSMQKIAKRIDEKLSNR